MGSRLLVFTARPIGETSVGTPEDVMRELIDAMQVALLTSDDEAIPLALRVALRRVATALTKLRTRRMMAKVTDLCRSRAREQRA